jgi:hypothetical protein
MRGQRPRFGREEETNSDDSASEDDVGRSLCSYVPYDSRSANKPNSKVSTNTPAGEEKEIGRARGER